VTDAIFAKNKGFEKKNYLSATSIANNQEGCMTKAQ
jgi:hypothetical protein